MYDVAPDGNHILVMSVSGVSETSDSRRRINIVQNWTEELKRLVPVP